MENSKVVSIRLPASVVDEYDAIATRYNMSRNTFLGVLLRMGYIIMSTDEQDAEQDAVFDDVVKTIGKAVNKK